MKFLGIAGAKPVFDTKDLALDSPVKFKLIYGLRIKPCPVGSDKIGIFLRLANSSKACF